MRGLVPRIHVFRHVDGRDKPGHDAEYKFSDEKAES
jgi:hypothetical protein